MYERGSDDPQRTKDEVEVNVAVELVVEVVVEVVVGVVVGVVVEGGVVFVCAIVGMVVVR